MYGPVRYGPIIFRSASSNSSPQHRQTFGGRTAPICQVKRSLDEEAVVTGASRANLSPSSAYQTRDTSSRGFPPTSALRREPERRIGPSLSAEWRKLRRSPAHHLTCPLVPCREGRNL